MKAHDLIQGSPQWLAYRRDHLNASDAPAMMGCSPYKSRGALLHEMHTGTAVDVDDATQRRFDEGHQSEALARPLAETIIGEDLYPVTGSEGSLSASFDGLTMDEATVWEHKALNDALRAVMPADVVVSSCGAELPPAYRVQLEQQLAVSGAGRALFSASKWDGEELVEVRHCWYLPDVALRGHILAGWSQFERDLAAYVPPTVAPIANGKAPETLPALRIEVTGMVTASNLDAFKATALAAIRGVNRELTTDVHFADAEKAVKWCGDVELRLAAAKDHALSQTASIDALFKAIDDISAEARAVRLEIEKLVRARKESIKGEIVSTARKAYDAHCDELRKETCGALSAIPSPDFAGAAKNKRTLAGLKDAVDTALAMGKIDADASAKRIRAALALLKDAGAGYEFLFSDTTALVAKPLDDLRLLVKSRIDGHKAIEAERARAEAAKTDAARVEAARKAEADRIESAARTERAMAAAEKTQAMQAALSVITAAEPHHAPAGGAAPAFSAPDADGVIVPQASLSLGESAREVLELRAEITLAIGKLDIMELQRVLNFIESNLSD